MAQDNDVDAFNGTINIDCTGQIPITAIATPATNMVANGNSIIGEERERNAVSGTAHCIGNDSRIQVETWAMGGSVGFGGSATTGKLQVRYEGF